MQIQKPSEIKIAAVAFKRVLKPDKYFINKIPGKVKNKSPNKGTTMNPGMLLINE